MHLCQVVFNFNTFREHKMSGNTLGTQEKSSNLVVKISFVVACMCSILILSIWVWNFYPELKRLFNDTPATVYHAMHTKELYAEKMALKKCLAETQYFERTAKQCKIDGKETLCFDTINDYYRYRTFKELCL